MNYQPKDLEFGKKGQEKLVKGIVKMSNAVKSTLGPGGNTVLIESPTHTHGITVTKDGVTVAKAIDLIDPVENLAVRIMKEAAERTATTAGDGTTTAIVLTEAMVLTGIEFIAPDLNRTEVLRHMVNIGDIIIEKLRLVSKKVKSGMIEKVASISANNDKAIGALIAEVYKSVGRNGIVAVEKSQTTETYTESTKGLQFKRGYLSPLFVNDQKRDECIFEDVMILVCDTEISNILQIEQILKPIISEGKKLLIIAPCGKNMLNTLSANVVRGNIKCCAVQPPNFGYRQHELMQDIALSVGATYFSEKTGDDLSTINFGDLGHAAKVVVGSDKTVIIRSDTKVNSEDISKRISELSHAYEKATKKSDKDFILERIASLTGGVGVIYVGGNTDLEQKELYDRVDDAVCAVRSALEEGILPGAGRALASLQLREICGEPLSKEQAAAMNIMQLSIKAPMVQILENSGLKPEQLYTDNTNWDCGYDVKTGTMGNLIDMGVVDPLKVTRSALQNAISVAVTILSTNAIVTMSRQYPHDDTQGYPM